MWGTPPFTNSANHLLSNNPMTLATETLKSLGTALNPSRMSQGVDLKVKKKKKDGGRKKKKNNKPRKRRWGGGEADRPREREGRREEAGKERATYWAQFQALSLGIRGFSCLRVYGHRLLEALSFPLENEGGSLLSVNPSGELLADNVPISFSFHLHPPSGPISCH